MLSLPQLKMQVQRRLKQDLTKEWQFMMENVLGVSANTYHCFDTVNAAKQFAYRCHCQIHQLSTRRHHAIVRNGRIYLCKKCKGQLQAV